jgi:hypothetical protein
VSKGLPFDPEKVLINCSGAFGENPWKSPKRLKIIRWMKKKGFTCPMDKIFTEAAKSYDLKVFRWIFKDMEESKISNYLGLLFSISESVSEEKLQWFAEHGGNFSESLTSLQAGIFLESIGERRLITTRRSYGDTR